MLMLNIFKNTCDHYMIYIYVLKYRLAESCNHIAAVLFKVDFSWNVGNVEKACTSLPVTWAGKNRQVAPMKIQDLNISKPTAEKTGKCVRLTFFIS